MSQDLGFSAYVVPFQPSVQVMWKCPCQSCYWFHAVRPHNDSARQSRDQQVRAQLALSVRLNVTLVTFSDLHQTCQGDV